MQTRREPRSIFNVYFVLIWIVTFMIQTTQNTNNNASIPYAVSLGMSNTLAGFIAIPYMIGAIIGRISSGYVCDYISRRAGMMLGSFSFLVGCVMLFFPFFTNAPCIMLARTLHGFGFACSTTAVTVASVDVAPPKASAMAMGLNFTGQGIAQASGGFLVDIFLTGTEYFTLFVATAVIALVALIAAALCRYSFVPALPPEGRPRFVGEFSPGWLFEKTAIPMSVVSCIFFFGLCFASFFTVAIALERGFSVSAYFTLSACFMVFSNIFLVKLGTRFGTKKIVIPTYVICALGMVVMGCTESHFLFSLCGLTYGLALGTMPLLQEEIVKVVPVENRGKGTSTLFIGQDIAMGIGTFLWGGLIDAFGFVVSGVLSAAIIIIAAVLLAVFLRKRFLRSKRERVCE